jgi:thiol-disulfide isomerase/thioredoxin
MDLSTDKPIAPTTGLPAAPPVVARTDDRVWKVLAATAAVVLIGFIVYVATRPHHPRTVAFPTTPAATLPLGTQAPDFSLTRLGGGPPVTLAATRGTPTVVNFFASWCPDCKAELAAFGDLADRTAGHLDVIGVDSDDNDGVAAGTLLSEAKATYPVGLDPDAKVATSYLLNALPVTYFLDRRGRVVHVAFGTQTPASLAKWTDFLTRSSVSAGGPS